MSESYKPFTPEQVKRIESYQRNGLFHPYTCPNRDNHLSEMREGILTVTPDGLKCDCCDYTQDWVHSFVFQDLPTPEKFIEYLKTKKD